MRVACAAVIALTAGIAHAAPPQSKEREQLIAEANAAVVQHRLDEGRRLWRILWEAEHNPKWACNVGQLSSRSGDYMTGREFLLICLSHDPENEVHRIELARVESHLGRLSIKAPVGSMVQLDDKPITPGAEPIWVEPGSYVVSAFKDDAKGVARVDVKAGTTEDVVLRLVAPPAPPTKPQPVVTAKPRVAQPASSQPVWPIWAGGLTAVSAAVAGGIVRGIAEQNRDDAETLATRVGPNRCFGDIPQCQEVRRLSESYFALRSVAVGLWIGAGVVGAGTTVYVLVRPPSSSSPTASIGVGGTW
jgi:hypothetical protein